MKSCNNCARKNYKTIDLVCQSCESLSAWIPIDEETEDMVNHPNHYKTKNGLETITVIEAFTDGLVGIEATDTGNVLKYMCRWKKKNGLQDLKKAQWYLNHLIRHIEIEESKNEKENN